MALSDLFKRRKAEPESSDVADAGPAQPSKVLPRFLAALRSREQPVLLDLGTVVGQNVNFFGDELGCKIFVEDICADIDRHVRDNTLAALPAFLGTRFPQPEASFDGILCWDVFDYLDRPAAQALAKQLVRILRPDGVLLGFFGSVETKPGPPTYTKHVVVDSTHVRPRPYPAARGRQKPLLNRDIIRMFEPLRVAEQFLLKTNVREVLFRKPAAPAA